MGTSLRSFACMDVGEGREQDAEALPILHVNFIIAGWVKRSEPVKGPVLRHNEITGLPGLLPKRLQAQAGQPQNKKIYDCTGKHPGEQASHPVPACPGQPFLYGLHAEQQQGAEGSPCQAHL